MLTEPWRIQLLGSLCAMQGEQNIVRFRAQKYGLLLAYLAYYHRRAHPREELAALFWPDAEPEAGRLNLRVALNSLRKRLEPPGVPQGSVLVAEGDTLRLHPDTFQTDVQKFEQALQAAAGADVLAARRDHLMAAVAAYQGRLLPGFYEDWVSVEQTRLEEQYRQALHRLIETLEQAGEPAKALDYAHQAVGLDALDERGQHLLIRLYLRLGQPGAAQRQFQELERRLHEEVGAQPALETRRLVEEPGSAEVTVARREQDTAAGRALPEKPTATAEAPSAAPVYCLLPPSLSRFYGRESERSALERLLADSQNRLLTIVGTAGVGKTRFAIEAARHFAERGSGAAAFVSLTGTRDPDLIPETIRTALRLPLAPNTPPLEQVVDFLRKPQEGGTHRALLLLDNLEHLLAVDATRTADIMQTLCTRIPALTLLVTSRQPLLIEGESRFPLASLPLPRLPGTPERLREFAGIQLFVDRAQAALPDFQITPRNLAAVMELCRRLDGLPLAIELAAAWAQTLTPVQMLQRLDKRFQMLVSRRRNSDPRHSSLHAAIASSYSLLPPEAQRLFCRLSVFRGGFTLEAAHEVCKLAEGEPEPSDSLENRLTLLQEHSLVGVEEQEEGLRFSLLESLREFAWEQLTPEEAYALACDHAAWCLQWVHRASQAAPKDLPPWLPVLRSEQANWHAALEFCFCPSLSGKSEVSPSDRLCVGMGTQLATDLSWYWQWCGAYTEARRWLECALEHVGADLADSQFALIRYLLSIHLYYQGEPRLAEAHCLSALSHWQEAWRPGLKADLLNLLGLIYAEQRENAKAECTLLEALKLSQELGDPRQIRIPLSNLGVLAKDSGDLAQARFYLEETLRYDRSLEDKQAIASSLNNLANIAVNQGDEAAVESYYQESLTLKRALGDRRGIANTLSNLSQMAGDHQDLPLAFTYMQESLALRKEMQDRRGQSISLVVLGDIVSAREPLRAVRFYAAAQTLFDRFHVPPPASVRQAIDAFLERTRSAEPGFEAAWNIGRSLAPDAAIEEALTLCAERGEAPTGSLLPLTGSPAG